MLAEYLADVGVQVVQDVVLVVRPLGGGGPEGCPGLLRRVLLVVEVDGVSRSLVYLLLRKPFTGMSNSLPSSAASISFLFLDFLVA